jgi:hypothetical protein
MPIPAQQHREIIEPGNHALQFHAVHQKHGDRGFALADMVQEHVLYVLRFFSGHVGLSLFLSPLLRRLMLMIVKKLKLTDVCVARGTGVVQRI